MQISHNPRQFKMIVFPACQLGRNKKFDESSRGHIARSPFESVRDLRDGGVVSSLDSHLQLMEIGHPGVAKCGDDPFDDLEIPQTAAQQIHKIDC